MSSTNKNGKNSESPKTNVSSDNVDHDSEQQTQNEKNECENDGVENVMEQKCATKRKLDESTVEENSPAQKRQCKDSTDTGEDKSEKDLANRRIIKGLLEDYVQKLSLRQERGMKGPLPTFPGGKAVMISSFIRELKLFYSLDNFSGIQFILDSEIDHLVEFYVQKCKWTLLTVPTSNNAEMYIACWEGCNSNLPYRYELWNTEDEMEDSPIDSDESDMQYSEIENIDSEYSGSDITLYGNFDTESEYTYSEDWDENSETDTADEDPEIATYILEEVPMGSDGTTDELASMPTNDVVEPIPSIGSSSPHLFDIICNAKSDISGESSLSSDNVGTDDDDTEDKDTENNAVSLASVNVLRKRLLKKSDRRRAYYIMDSENEYDD